MKFALVGTLTIATAADSKRRMLANLAGCDLLEIDTQDVTEVDVAGLQVLFSAFKSAVAAGVPVHFPKEGRGPAVARALDLLGLSEVDWNQKGGRHG